MRYVLFLALLLCANLLLSSCTEDPLERRGDFPRQGEIWADIENFQYVFNQVGSVPPSFLNTYSESTKALSMYRELPFQSNQFGSFRIVIVNFDLNDTTPRQIDKNKLNLSFSPQQNVLYNGTGDDILSFEILSIENDIIKAVFEANLTSNLNPTQKISVRNGAVHMRIVREN